MEALVFMPIDPIWRGFYRDQKILVRTFHFTFELVTSFCKGITLSKHCGSPQSPLVFKVDQRDTSFDSRSWVNET